MEKREIGRASSACFFGLLVVPSETVRKHKMHEIPVFNSNTPYDAAPKNGPREGDKVSKKL